MVLNGQKDYTKDLMWIRTKKACGEINKCISPFSLNFNPQTHRNTHTHVGVGVGVGVGDEVAKQVLKHETAMQSSEYLTPLLQKA